MICPFRPVDLEILKLFADGFTADDVSNKTGKRLFTITYIIRKMRSEIDAYNTTHLVVIALREGWIK